MNNRFHFYEVVVVVQNYDQSLQSVIGKEGTILGMSQDEETSRWSYAVSIASTGVVWNVAERYLESTGKRQDRSDLYSGDSVKVNVDPKSGDGSLG